MLLHLAHREEAREIIAKYQKDGPTGSRVKRDRPKVLVPPPGLGPLTAPHIRYLAKRGFDADDLVKTWEIQGTTYHSKEWNWRVVYPVRNRAGTIVAYQGRSISNDVRPKYRLSDQKEILDDPNSLLYGIHLVPRDAVIIVEGALDAWSIGPGGVATFGIDWKDAQVRILKEFPRRFVLYDPEPKAQARALALAEALSIYRGETELLDGHRTDPGAMTRRAVARLRRELAV